MTIMDEHIRKILQERQYTQEECYKRLGRTRDDIAGDIQPAIAVELEFLLDMDARNICGCSVQRLTAERKRFLKRLEGREMEDFARKFPVRALKGMGYLSGGHSLPWEILKFMGVSSIEGWKSYYGDLQGTVNPYAYSAWIRLGELKCERPKGEIPLDRSEIEENLFFLRKNAFSLQINLRKMAKEALEACGFLMLQVPAFTTAPLPDAACYWCGNRPVIQFSGNTISDVRFLKALYHAVGHILMHPKRSVCLQGSLTQPTADRQSADVNPEGAIRNKREQEAELFAERLLLTEAEECEIICCGRFAERGCIEYFSRVFKVRPGIIVDRLQQQKKLPRRTLLNSFKVAV